MNDPRSTTKAATVLLLLLGAALGAPSAWSQPEQFPGKAVTLITSFSAGSGPDAMMRVAATELAVRWKVPVVVDNRPGGAGFIAINAVRSAPADGHTLLMSDLDGMAALPHLFRSRNFRPLDAFDPVGGLYGTPFFVVVSAASRWKSVGELITAAKSNPGKVTYGSWGVGSVGHLYSAILATKADVQMLHVPYKEMSQLYTGVSTSETDWALGAMASTQFVYQPGKVRYLAVAARQRLADMPDVPTLAEAGGPADVEAKGYVAMFAPKGTPRPIIDKINKDLIEVTKGTELASRFKTFRFEAVPWSPAEVRKAIEDKTSTFEHVIKTHAITVE